MIETISDFMSIAILVVIVILGIIYFYDINIKHREETMKSIESRYYRYYEGVDDADDEDSSEPYFED